MNAADPVKAAWLDASPPPPLPQLAHVRSAANRFQRQVRLRNAVEYAAAALVIVAFGAMALFAPIPLPTLRIGAAMVVLGTLFVVWQLHQRASAADPREQGTLPVLRFHLKQLERQRDALASVWRWYLLPVMPGMLTVMAAPVIDGGPQVLAHLGAADAFSLLLPMAIFALIGWVNSRAARRLQVTIDDLNGLGEE